MCVSYHIIVGCAYVHENVALLAKVSTPGGSLEEAVKFMFDKKDSAAAAEEKDSAAAAEDKEMADR